MNIELVETQELLGELRNRFAAFVFAGLCREEDESDEATVYVFHGGTILCIGLSQLMEHPLKKRRREYTDNKDNTT